MDIEAVLDRIVQQSVPYSIIDQAATLDVARSHAFGRDNIDLCSNRSSTKSAMSPVRKVMPQCEAAHKG